MSAVLFTVFGKPQPAGSKTVGRTKAGGTFVRDANPNAREWKQAIAQRAGEVMEHGGFEMLEGPLELCVTFQVPRPKGHFGKRGLLPSAPAHPTVAPDATKLLRAVEDGMQGVVFRNDAQIVQQQVAKQYGEPARAVVFIKQL